MIFCLTIKQERRMSMLLSPEQMKKNIIDQLYWDSSVDASDVTIEIANNVVTLRGTVPSFAARRSAETDVMIATGASTAIDNQLAVEYPGNLSMPTDAELLSNVKNILIWSPNIDASRLDISVDSGLVTLEGSADSFWQKRRAEELVYELTGVMGVRNNIMVVPTENVVDEAIAQDVISALDRNYNVEIDEIDVQVSNGVVTLKGTVPNWIQYYAAEDTANYTRGVISVINEMAVQQPEFANP